MSEFLKHLLALCVLSVMALTQGFDSRAPGDFSASTHDNVVSAPLSDAASARSGDDSMPDGTDAPYVRPGVAVAQATPDAARPVDPAKSMGNPARTQSEGLAHAQPQVRIQISPDDPSATETPAPEPGCRLSPTQGYGSINIRGGPSERPAALHPDMNLGQRAWKAVSAPLSLLSVGGPTDGGAPRFASLFASGRMPRMTGAYQVYNWDFRAGRRTTPITSPEVTLIGFATTPGEMVLLPDSGYSIGNGYSALVLYADTERVTLKYTREDNVAVGYTLHLENICVDPRLLASYRALDAAGRWRLPAIRSGQAVGNAAGSQMLAGIQDSGSWMDPRSRKDWWQ